MEKLLNKEKMIHKDFLEYIELQKDICEEMIEGLIDIIKNSNESMPKRKLRAGGSLSAYQHQLVVLNDLIRRYKEIRNTEEYVKSVVELSESAITEGL